MDKYIDARDMALSLVAEGIISSDQLASMAVQWLSNDDVAEMLDAHELSERFLFPADE